MYVAENEIDSILKLVANNDHESNNLFTKYRLRIARDLHNILRRSSRSSLGCLKLKASCYKKLIL